MFVGCASSKVEVVSDELPMVGKSHGPFPGMPDYLKDPAGTTLVACRPEAKPDVSMISLDGVRLSSPMASPNQAVEESQGSGELTVGVPQPTGTNPAVNADLAQSAANAQSNAGVAPGETQSVIGGTFAIAPNTPPAVTANGTTLNTATPSGTTTNGNTSNGTSAPQVGQLQQGISSSPQVAPASTTLPQAIQLPQPTVTSGTPQPTPTPTPTTIPTPTPITPAPSSSPVAPRGIIPAPSTTGF